MLLLRQLAHTKAKNIVAMSNRNIDCVCSYITIILLYFVAFANGMKIDAVRTWSSNNNNNNNSNQEITSTATATAVCSSSSDVVVSRRRCFGIVSSAAAACGCGLSSSLLLPTHSASADPYNAFLPVGSGGILQQATIEKADGWNTPTLLTQLGMSRIENTSLSSSSSSSLSSSTSQSQSSLSPLQQSLSPFASQDIYYPSFFNGEWNITSTLKSKIFPFGPDFVPSRSLVEGSPRNRQERVGDSTSYLVRYFPIDHATSSSNSGGGGGGGSGSKIISDRRFNIVSMTRSYQQLSPVISDSIEWNYKKDPTRLSFQTESVSADMRPIGKRRGEVYLTARKTEEKTIIKNPSTTTTTSDEGSVDNNNDNDNNVLVFAAAERGRTVTIGGIGNNVSANDQEVITEFKYQINNNNDQNNNDIAVDKVTAISRVAVYLTPNPNSREGVLWQQINGKAVAFYDYELIMKRNK